MRLFTTACAAFMAATILIAMESKPAATSPDWAYGIQDPPVAKPPTPAPDKGLKHLTGSDGEFTRAQIRDFFGPADWFPQDHPAMPDIVARGRRPEVWACAMCHYPNGKGRPENAGIAGLPKSYFIEQMNAFRNGERTSADSRKKNTGIMISIAKGMTTDEIKSAADYFASMQWTPWIQVVETAQVPKTYTSAGMFLPIGGGAKEPLGQRIIEMPKDPEATEELRNPRASFIAYVPVGSLKKGRHLASGADKNTVACTPCHGAGLRGLGPVPGIAGRSPSYLMRQLYDMQQGTRHGEWTQLMMPVVKKLTTADMLALAAYAASLQP